MRFDIKTIILWSRNASFKPRTVSFKAGTVNIISGASQTGKSALISIVDYCLGAGKCAIPVGVIRESTAWFGVVIQTDLAEILVARREPGAQQSTDDMYMAEGKSVDIPKVIKAPNVNRSFVKQYFDSLAGLSSLDLEADSSNMYKARPSFRDMAAFNFQPQSIIANPQVLFFKADTTEHREKLKNVMPYALGVTTPEIIAKQYELEQLRREQRSKRRELESLTEATKEWLTELRIHLSQAREFGLLSSDTPIDLPETQAVSALRRVVSRSSDVEGANQATPRPTLNRIQGEIAALRHREQEHALTLGQLRKRLVEMSKLRDAAEAYSAALVVEEGRLGISRWLLERSSEAKGDCPVCGNELRATHSHLAELLTSLEEVEKGSVTFRTLPPTFDKEWGHVHVLIRETTDALTNVQKEMKALQTISEAERARRYTELNASRFVGRIEAGLLQYDRLNQDKHLKSRLEELNERIQVLLREVDESVIEGKKRQALQSIWRLMDEMLGAFGVEDAHDPAVLNLKELTLQIERAGRKDYLWEVGSASNWLGYHLAVILALHRHFIALNHSSVPSFVMLDQPSQVYFPTKLAGRKKEANLEADDRVRVRAIFAELARMVESMKGRFQLIVVDHAGRDVWGDISGINVVGDWRGEDRLIPSIWRGGADASEKV